MIASPCGWMGSCKTFWTIYWSMPDPQSSSFLLHSKQQCFRYQLWPPGDCGEQSLLLTDGWVTDWVKTCVLSNLWTLGSVCYCSMREPLPTDTVSHVQFHSVYIDVTLKTYSIKKTLRGLPWWSRAQDSVHPVLGVRVPFLVGELGSCMLYKNRLPPTEKPLCIMQSLKILSWAISSHLYNISTVPILTFP